MIVKNRPAAKVVKTKTRAKQPKPNRLTKAQALRTKSAAKSTNAESILEKHGLKFIITGVVLALVAGVMAVVLNSQTNAADGSIKVGGTELYSGSTHENDAKTASYDTSSKTLTLNNYSGSGVVISNLDDITVKISGTSTITDDDNAGVYSSGSFAITAADNSAKLNVNSTNTERSCLTSNGSMTINSGSFTLNCNYGIHAANGLDIKAGTFSFNSTGSTRDVYVTSGDASISGGTFNSTAHNFLLVGAGKIAISGGTIKTGTISTNNGAIAISGGALTITSNSSSDGISSLGGGDIAISGGTIAVSGGAISLGSTVSNHYAMRISGGDITVNTNNSGAPALVVNQSQSTEGIVLASNMHINNSCATIRNSVQNNIASSVTALSDTAYAPSIHISTAAQDSSCTAVPTTAETQSNPNTADPVWIYAGAAALAATALVVRKVRR